MHLLVLHEEPYYNNGKDYFSKSSSSRFIEFFLHFFNKISICAPCKKIDLNESNQLLKFFNVSKKINIIELPYWKGIEDFFLQFPNFFWRILKIVDQNIKKNDVIWIRLPSITGIIFFIFSKIHRKPIVLYVAGDIEKAWDSLKYGGVKKIIAKAIIFLLDKSIAFMSRFALVLITGQELYQKYNIDKKKGLLFIDSLIQEKNLFFRIDTCNNRVINLLWVGKIVPKKGIFYLLTAVKELLDAGNEVNLILVGYGPYKEKLKKKIRELNIQKNVEFLGYIRFGKNLFQIYRNADIFILPSLSEGMPRVILEAWASSIPVIATEIGGIPSLIQNNQNGLLIKPGSVKELCMAVERIKQNKALRQKLIKNGLKSVQNYTTKKQVQNALDFIFTFYPNLKNRPVA